MIPIASVCAKPFTVPEPFKYNTTAAISVVILPSNIAQNALPNPLVIDVLTVFPDAIYSLIRANIITLASTAIPIVSTIPAIPGSVSVISNALSINTVNIV